MKKCILIMFLGTIMLSPHFLPAADGEPNGDPSKRQSEIPLVEKTLERLGNIRDSRTLSLEERKQLIAEINAAGQAAEKASNAYLEAHVLDVLKLVSPLSSYNLNDRAAQQAISQRIVLKYLPLADRFHLTLEYQLMGYLQKRHDAAGNVVSGEQWRKLRNQLMEYRLHLWRRIESRIDPTWDPTDTPVSGPIFLGDYPPYVAPEAVKEPELRRRYEAALEARQKKSERHREQGSLRKLRDRYVRHLKDAIVDAYRTEPVTEEDLDMLKAYLRIYVADEAIRKEFCDLAESAAKGTPKE